MNADAEHEMARNLGSSPVKQVAQFLWVGSDLSPLENVCLKSFVTVGYETHLYTYGDVGNIPEGVIVKNANEIIAEDDPVFGPRTCGGRYANFSDRFRYYLLHERGGWWFDTDHIALKLFPAPTDLLIATQWEGYEHPTGSVLWCKPGDERILWARNECDKIIKAGGDWEYVALGPALVKRMVEHFKLYLHLAPWWEFNPYQHYYVRFLAYHGTIAWLKDIVRLIVHRRRQKRDKGYRAAYIRSGSRAIHLSNEIWRAKGLDKNALYHPLSAYGRLQRKHGFTQQRA